MGCCGLIASDQPIGSGANPDLQVAWGYSLTVGGRWYMEDYHTAKIEEPTPGKPIGCFAVYDGHGGRQCVQFVQQKLFKAIISNPAFSKGEIPRAMHEGYMQVDDKFYRKKTRATCGTTATTIILHEQQLHVAHCGDSRAVLVQRNGVLGLTKDHKPTDPDEAARIEAKGGTIVQDDVARVCGVLAVTRAFGNNTIKSTVTAEPDVYSHDITPNDEFFVIASDGVWDVLSNEDVATIVQTSDNMRTAAEDITLEAYRLNSTDNISAVVVALNFSGPIPVGHAIANAVRNFSNRGVRPPRQNSGEAPPPPAGNDVGALTTKFDQAGLRGGGTRGGQGAPAGEQEGGVYHRHNSGRPEVTGRTPPQSPLSDQVGYAVFPPGHPQAQAQQAAHYAAQEQQAYAYAPGQGDEQIDFEQHQMHHMQDPSRYDSAGHGYNWAPGGDGVVYDGGQGALGINMHDAGYADMHEEGDYDQQDHIALASRSAPVGGGGDPGMNMMRYDRSQHMHPDVAAQYGGFQDMHGYHDMHVGFGMSRLGQLEDIAEEGPGDIGESADMGTSGSHQNISRRSMEQYGAVGWSSEKNGGTGTGRAGRGVSPPRGASPPRRGSSPQRKASPPRHVQQESNGWDEGGGQRYAVPRQEGPSGSPPRHNGYRESSSVPADITQRRSPQQPAPDTEMPPAGLGPRRGSGNVAPPLRPEPQFHADYSDFGSSELGASQADLGYESSGYGEGVGLRGEGSYPRYPEGRERAYMPNVHAQSGGSWEDGGRERGGWGGGGGRKDHDLDSLAYRGSATQPVRGSGERDGGRKGASAISSLGGIGGGGSGMSSGSARSSRSQPLSSARSSSPSRKSSKRLSSGSPKRSRQSSQKRPPFKF